VLIGLSTEHSSQRIIGQEVKLNDSRQIIAFLLTCQEGISNGCASKSRQKQRENL
jgi:hypothetical protein